MNDPMEQLIRDALSGAGIRFQTDDGGGNPRNLDFYLPDLDLHIEVKQFHSERVAEQMARAENVIVAQGKDAVIWLARLITATAAIAS